MIKTMVLSAALALACGAASAQEHARLASQTFGSERQERYELAHRLVSEWGPYVKAIYGEEIGPWAKRLTPTLQQASTHQLRDAVLADSYAAMMNGLTGGKAPDPKFLPGGVAPKALGDATADLVFTPLPQCNIVDTRNVGGTLTANIGRHYKGSGASFVAQGGSNTNCGIPSNVTALLLGVTAVNQTAKGFFRLWPYGESIPVSSSMSYGPTQNTRNDVVVRMSQGLAMDFSVVSSTGGGHLLISVLGYYAPPVATALQCQGTAIESRSIAAGYNNWGSAPACPTGYTPIVPYCWGPTGGVQLKGSGLIGNGSGSRSFCHWHNTTASAQTVYEGTMCCRVPGR